MQTTQSHSAVNRRGFIKAGMLSSTVLALSGVPRLLVAAVTKPPQPAYHGLKMGMASYTFRKFPLEQTIAMTKQAGAGYISLKDFHLSYKSGALEREEVRKKIEEAGLVLISGGVIYMKNDEQEVRGFFQYAKDAGMPTI